MNGSTQSIGRLLGRSEVARIFGVSPSTITRWADEGKLPVIKTLGGHRRYDADAVSELVQQHSKEQSDMEEIVMGLPAMYADHHVLAVRQILLGMPGVESVEASAAFKTVRICFDPTEVSSQILGVALQDAGYPPSGLDGSTRVANQVPVSTGKKDPAWAALGMRTIETHPAELGK